jgi:ATP-binding protein involved in chromosome partitioning
MITREEILKALSKVIYPGKEDIVTMGMVQSAEATKEGIRIVLKSQRQKDPVITSLKHVCVQSLKESFGSDIVVADIEVITPEPAKKIEPVTTDMLPEVANVIAIASGKGGVGKSTVAVNTAVALAKKGYKVGLLDADIFGPSTPKMFNEETYRPELRSADGKEYIIPLEKYGVKILSVGFFVDPSEAVVWRGPMASNFLKQMISQGDWGKLDYLLIDLPPGTSDIHLTLVQEVGLTGAVIVSTPQEVALADAIKGISMFRTDKINVPVLGLIENMAWFTPEELPDNRYYIFGKDGCKKLAEKLDVPLIGQIPIVQGICESGDSGVPTALGNSATAKAFEQLASDLVIKIDERNRNLDPTRRVIITKT